MSIESQRRPGDLPPSHPGEILNELFLKPEGITQSKFAEAIGVKPGYVSDIVNGRRGVSAEMALRFEAALGQPAQFWLNLQNSVDVYRARLNVSEAAKRLEIRHFFATACACG